MKQELPIIGEYETNGDSLRAKSNTELADIFCQYGSCPGVMGGPDSYSCSSYKNCKECWLDWLRAPAVTQEGDFT